MTIWGLLAVYASFCLLVLIAGERLMRLKFYLIDRNEEGKRRKAWPEMERKINEAIRAYKDEPR